jgi:cytochrome d ubiquinol oxidase subunit I
VGEGVKARAEITDFWEMVFNPSSVDRLSHVLCGAWQAGAFLVISVSAFYLLRRKHTAFAEASLKIGLVFALLASTLQIVTGHNSALGVIENQPAKMAAFEGHYETGEMPLYLFGWVNEAAGEVKHAAAMPRAVSRFLVGSGPITGLEEFAPEDRPPVNAVFQLYHVMVAIGMGLFLVSAAGVVQWWRGSLFARRWFLWVLVFAVLGPQLANQFGWFAAEIGRQPWIVYGLLRTSEGLSAVVKAEAVAASLLMFAFVYALLFAVFVYLLNDKIQKGPDAADLTPRGKLALPTKGAS